MKTNKLKPVLSCSVLAAALCAPVLFVQPAFAQQFFDGDEGYYDEPEGDNPADGLIPGTSNNNPYGILRTLRATPEATGTVTRALRTSYTFCDRVQRPEYLVDCLGVELEVIAKAMSPSGDYAEARVILLEASQKLRKLATENASKAESIPSRLPAAPSRRYGPSVLNLSTGRQPRFWKKPRPSFCAPRRRQTAG
jgi:hypothetical protein